MLSSLIQKRNMIHAASCECAVGGVDLFNIPPTQTVITRRYTIELHPTGNTSDDNPIELVASAPDDDYTALSLHDLEIKAKIVKKNGGNLTDADKVGLVNFPLHSIWSQVDVYVGEELVTSSNHNYAYAAVFEKLLTYDKRALETQFSAEMYATDTAGSMDDVDAENKGLVKRREYTNLSKTFTLRGSLHVPILRQERFLINKLGLKIVLIPNNSKFYLMSAIKDDNDYKLF